MLSEFSDQLSRWAIPAILFLIPLIGYLRGVKVYETFVEGAAEGFGTAIRIMPFLVAMLVAIHIFRSSGAMDVFIGFLQPFLEFFNIPPELAPLALMRPLSGSGSLGITMELLDTYGPDSLIGRMASTILGSTDTTFYILTVYFGAIGVSNPRYSVIVGLAGDLIGFFCAIYIWQSFM